MVIDMHYHLEERMVTLDGLLEQMDRDGISRIALIPALSEPFETSALAAKAGHLVRNLLQGGLRPLALAVYRSTVKATGKAALLNVLIPIYPVPDNEPVARALRSHPDRFYGWIAVNPKTGDPCAEAAKWVGQPGWIGVKTHPFWHQYPVALLDGLADFCAQHELPLLVHLGGGDGHGDFRYLPERHPTLKIVYAHAGLPAYGQLWEYAAGKPNIFVDLSCSPYVGRREMLGAIKALGARRCLFGSDGPYIGREFRPLVRAIQALPVPEKDKELILSGGFLELTGLAH